MDKLINGSEEAPQDEADKEEAREVSSEQEEEEEQRIDLPLLRLVHGPIENIAENARVRQFFGGIVSPRSLDVSL